MHRCWNQGKDQYDRCMARARSLAAGQPTLIVIEDDASHLLPVAVLHPASGGHQSALLPGLWRNSCLQGKESSARSICRRRLQEHAASARGGAGASEQATLFGCGTCDAPAGTRWRSCDRDTAAVTACSCSASHISGGLQTASGLRGCGYGRLR